MKKYLLASAAIVFLLTFFSCSENPISPPGLGGSLLKPPRLDSIIFLADTAVWFKLTDLNDTVRFHGALFTYSIEQAEGSGPFHQIARVDSNKRFVTVPDSFQGDQNFYFRTRTMTTGDTSAYSDFVLKTLFFTPRQLKITSITDSVVTLAWQDSCSYETGFVVEQSSDGVSFVQVDTLGPNALGDTLPGIYSSLLTYSYRVYARSAVSLSAYSNIAAGTIEFTPPGNVHLITLSATQVRIEWQDNTTIETGYEIQISTDGAAYAMLAQTARDSTGVTVTGSFIEGKTYSFRVRALRTKNSITNYSAFSNIALGGVIDAAGIDWVAVEGASFTMGTNGGMTNEQPATSVRLDTYKIGRTEITFDQYHQFCLDSTAYADPPNSGWGSGNRPVINVSWEDAAAFCRWASTKTGKTIRLPSEAEWEFACRGGKSSGNYSYSGSNTVSSVAWTFENSSSRTQLVGSKQVNELGIYDMSGNVWEWCSDWYGQYPGGSVVNPTGPAAGASRVLRGGSWFSFSRSASVYSRTDGEPGAHSYDVGFRVVKMD